MVANSVSTGRAYIRRHTSLLVIVTSSYPTLTMQSLSVKNLLCQAQDKVVKLCRKARNTLYPLSKDSIAEHLCWNSGVFEQQEELNKARCESISSVREKNSVLRKELAAQKEINQANSKRIRAIEKILKLNPHPSSKKWLKPRRMSQTSMIVSSCRSSHLYLRNPF